MTTAGLEPTISASERPQTYTLDRAATGTGLWFICLGKMIQILGRKIDEVGPCSPDCNIYSLSWPVVHMVRLSANTSLNELKLRNLRLYVSAP